jgi:energy-coupling factor transporter ATP-binding protein EcfA2
VTPMISYRSVAFAYPDGPTAVADLDLDIADGSMTLVVGGSGSGKSTVLRMVNGLVPHTSGGRFSGDVEVGGRSIRNARPRDLADLVGFVHQDPEAQFVVDQVEGDVAFSLENLGVDPESMRRRVEEVLDALGIAHLRHRSPSTLSGGERQRAAIAGALATAPQVLVLDEPTSELDPQGAEDVLAAVQRLNLDLGTTVLLAEHRLERAAHLVDNAVVLASGKVVASGAPSSVLPPYPGAPTVTQLGRLLGWAPPPLTVRDARRAAQAQPPELSPVDNGTDRAASGEDVIVARGASQVRDRAEVLAPVDLHVHAGECLAVLGRNGSGKTTLLRILAGIDEPAAGSVDRRFSTAFVPQDPNSLLFAPTVRRELEETLKLRRLDDDGRVDRWLEQLGLDSMAERHPRSLSSGERQRVAIATVAVGGARVLMLDEPTRGMDARSREALEQAIAAHIGGGGAVLLATHDVELAARVATSVLVLADGDIVAHGDMRTVLSGSLFAPQTLRVLPPHLTVAEVERAMVRR